MSKTFGIVVIVALAFLVLLALISLVGSAVPAFDPALEAWTKWVASIVAIIVSARVLWAGASWLRKAAGLTP